MFGCRIWPPPNSQRQIPSLPRKPENSSEAQSYSNMPVSTGFTCIMSLHPFPAQHTLLADFPYLIKALSRGPNSLSEQTDKCTPQLAYSCQEIQFKFSLQSHRISPQKIKGKPSEDMLQQFLGEHRLQTNVTATELANAIQTLCNGHAGLTGLTCSLIHEEIVSTKSPGICLYL